jgi:hypothetical protein
LLRYRRAILKKANAKANNFCGLERTMPNAREDFLASLRARVLRGNAFPTQLLVLLRNSGAVLLSAVLGPVNPPKRF